MCGMCVTVEKTQEMTNVTKMKTGSSSSGSSDSSDSEDSENGISHDMAYTSVRKTNNSNKSRYASLVIFKSGSCVVLPTGQVPKQQKTLTNKDSKRPHHQSLSGGTGPGAPQAQAQVVQSKPLFVPPIPVPVPVAGQALEASHLLTSGFDPLAHFMNQHLTQSNTESNAVIASAGAPIASGLLNTNAPSSQTSSETHAFLNQHPIMPSPGVCTSVTPSSRFVYQTFLS